MTRAENMIRVGIVSSVNIADKTARVIFPDSGNLVSDWLFVLQHGGNWMPDVQDRVVCAISCGDETDGYILGAIP